MSPLTYFILSRQDLDELIMRGQDNSIFSKCQIAHSETLGSEANPLDAQLRLEEYEDYLQVLAAKHFLIITRLDRDKIGDTRYDELQFENMYARDFGTKQMMKEMDFDIILKSCKQRIEFQQTIEEIKMQETRQ